MPTYRRPIYLREALASAVSQTYRNLQIIVRDNASGDETPDVVRSFKDPRIEFYQAAQTESALENGNACLAKVKGKYVFTICDDDLAGPNYVEVLLGHLERDSTILVAYGATHLIDEHGAVTGKRVPNGTYTWQAADIIEAWCAGTIPLATGVNYFSTAAFLKTVVEGIQFLHGQNSDNAMFMTAAIKGRVLFTDQCVFFYRQYASNSQRFFRSHERTDADRDFLSYLDGLVSSDATMGLPKAKWPDLRQRLQAMLARNYYELIRLHNLEKESFLHTLRATTMAPAAVYGMQNALRYSRSEKATILHHLGPRLKSLLRNDAGHTTCDGT